MGKQRGPYDSYHGTLTKYAAVRVGPGWQRSLYLPGLLRFRSVPLSSCFPDASIREEESRAGQRKVTRPPGRLTNSTGLGPGSSLRVPRRYDCGFTRYDPETSIICQIYCSGDLNLSRPVVFSSLFITFICFPSSDPSRIGIFTVIFEECHPPSVHISST